MIETKYDYRLINQGLKEKVLLVSFTKKDGERRDMTCTLREDFIPEDKRPKLDGKTRLLNTEVMNVFDIKAQDWRSFRMDSIISVEDAE